MPSRFEPKGAPFKVTLGQRGEMIAGGYLVRSGFKVLDRNFRCAIGEIDFVAEKDGRIHFIEVKTRSGTRFGLPQEAVGAFKQRKLTQLASWYLKDRKMQERGVSFTVMSVLIPEGGKPDVTLIENAFMAGTEA